MSDEIKHECGIIFMRLLKPISYYEEKYKSPFWALNCMHIAMQKQRNRGQDGAGIATVKIDNKPGKSYIKRIRSNQNSATENIFNQIKSDIANHKKKPYSLDILGQIYLGHIRYCTHGDNSLENTQPILKRSNWRFKNLVIAGNFNLTNADYLFKKLVNIGQHPLQKSDSNTIMEKIGYWLDKDIDTLYGKYQNGKHFMQNTKYVEENLQIEKALKNASKKWDGGYVICGILGHGDSFIFRDNMGIRPIFYYKNDEIVFACSERIPIKTLFNPKFDDIKELDKGSALIVKKSGDISIKQINTPSEKNHSCSFERIYFSRGNDISIYKERKTLGKKVAPQVIKSIKSDFKNTVFSFIPNTSETAFYGMMEEINEQISKIKIKQILSLKEINHDNIQSIISLNPRIEKVAIKDDKMRTFITDDKHRNEFTNYVYDITYGIINSNKDNLVLLDDSIVRGNTLKNSILKMMNKLKPKKIIIVSSAPQIRYPDCYGIDMAKLQDLIAFEAVINLIKKSNKMHILDQVYQKCKSKSKVKNTLNFVKEIYNPFSTHQISQEISNIISVGVKAEVEVIFQTIENLYLSCPNNRGSWYFNGDYPTKGGNHIANRAFINFIEKKDKRAYS